MNAKFWDGSIYIFMVFFYKQSEDCIVYTDLVSQSRGETLSPSPYSLIYKD